MFPMTFSTFVYSSRTIVRLTYRPTLQKNLSACLAISSRNQTSGLPPLKKERINNNMQLTTIQDDRDGSTRPLVLLFGWMLAKQRHVEKYANLYHSKGFDVLSLLMKPTQVLLPKKAQKTVDTLLSVLEEDSLTQKPLMVHGFSVGGYMYGECLVKLSENRKRYQNIRDRMVGQIFDSPVDFAGIPAGFATILTKNKLGRSLIKSGLEGYMHLFRGPITSHYVKSSETFRANEMRLPSLLLYSRADPIGVADRIEEVMRQWKDEGVLVSGRCWESSPHVSHFHRHPDEYVEAVLAFVQRIGLSQQENQRQVKEAQAQ